MGSIRKIERQKGAVYEAAIYANGRRKSKTFKLKAQAKNWINEQELATVSVQSQPFKSIIFRYIKEVTPKKKSSDKEARALLALTKDLLAKLKTDEIQPKHIADYRDRRLKLVSNGSVSREMNYLSAIFTTCVNEWQLATENPVRKVKRPRKPKGRDRRISDEEIESLRIAFDYNDSIADIKHLVFAYFLLGIETAMRAGELRSVTKETLHDKHVVLHDTKNGESRDVPLNKKARALFQLVVNCGMTLTDRQLDANFRKYKKKTDVVDLRFHDTRHEGLTRLSQKVDVLQLAKIAGHKNINQLLTYYNPTPDEIADKLD